MPAPLTLAAAQPPGTSHDVEANVAAHVRTIRAARSRMLLFPELSLSGYELDAETGKEPAAIPSTPTSPACARTTRPSWTNAPTASPPATASGSPSRVRGPDRRRLRPGRRPLQRPHPDGLVMAQAGPEPGDLARATLL